MSYEETVRYLFDLLATFNTADSTQPHLDWLLPEDVFIPGGAYQYCHDLLVAIAGNEIIEHWSNTCEIEMSLATRYKG